MDADGDSLYSTSGNRTGNTTATRCRLLQSGVVAAALLAGCLDESTDESGTDDDSGSGTQSADDETESDEDGDDESDPDDDPVSVVYAYLEAAIDEDLDGMGELSHSQNPLDPAALVEDGWEFRGGGEPEDLETVEATVVDDDAAVADLFALPAVEVMFDEDELAESLDGAAIALVEVTGEEPTEDEMTWILATEDGEWRYLHAVPVDDTPENPEDLFEEPIEDEDNRVIVGIDWEHDSQTSDIPQAAVEITDDRGIDANRIEIESTIEGASTASYDRDDDEFTATWDGGSTLFVAYNTDGDQIVVTAINEAEDESTVVHREHYLP